MSREGVQLGNDARAVFIWNDVALHQTLQGSTGPVARDLAERAVKVESRAKLNASGRPGPNVDTGRLRASIGWRLVEIPGGIAAEIGTNVEYAEYLEVTGVGSSGVTYPFLRPALVAAGGTSYV
jgi:hypothetical protein